MKKTVKFFMGLALASSLVSLSLVSCKKKASDEKYVGVLSYLNMSEEDFHKRSMGALEIRKILSKKGYLKINDPLFGKVEASDVKVRYYDTLDSMLMALKSGEISAIGGLPQVTANYICHRDPSLELGIEYDVGKHMNEKLGADDFVDGAFARLGDGFSFMMLEKNAALRDQFDKVISEMKKDGSMEALIHEQIIKQMKGGEIKATIPEQKEGRKTIKVAVTGDLPPMDYVAADGSFAGFNTALLSEIGKKLDLNISMVQVSSVGRAAALASETVDVVFWTRSTVSSKRALLSMTPEEFNEWRESRHALDSEEEISAMRKYTKSIIGDAPANDNEIEFGRDMPEGTIITIPYFTSIPVGVLLRK